MNEHEDRTEQIGAVTLDYSWYPGEDYYSDGPVEDEILSIVKESDPGDYEKVIREKKEWPVLYHLSSARGNIVDWIPFTGTEKVLEIGAGPGAITDVLARRCGEVTCVELSRKRSLINAFRHRNCSNVKILVGNFEDIEPHLDLDYDYIFLIGVFEYAASYLRREKDPFRKELALIRQHVRKNAFGQMKGRIVLAIENRLGLKYFAGCREDHSGVFFDGIEDYRNGPHPATTFSKPALEQYFREEGMGEYSFYYPYPDYKFMETLYSDRRLPDGAELSDNIRNFDRDRLLLFDEKKAYGGLVRDGLYPLFSNSFEVVLGPALPVVYCKFSSDRAPQYRIRTALFETDAQGQKRIVKYPLGDTAKAHVDRLPEVCQKLSARFSGQEILRVAACHMTEDGGASFDYISGRTMESLLDERLNAGDRDGFCQLVEEYRRLVSFHDTQGPADPDMTFANLILDEDRKAWTAIDYEWAVERPIRGTELTCRSLLCYYREDPARQDKAETLVGKEALLALTGLTQEEAAQVAREEDAFQAQVTGGSLSLGSFRALMRAPVLRPVELQSEAEKEEGRKRNREEELRQQREAYEKNKALTGVKIYFDTGKGYNEEQTLEIEQLYQQESVNTFDAEVAADVHRLRIDPASVPCLVLLREIRLNDDPSSEAVLMKLRRHNGSACEGGALLYAGNDPWMDWDLDKVRRKCGITHRNPDEKDRLHVSLQMTGIPGTMAERIRRTPDRRHGF